QFLGEWEAALPSDLRGGQFHAKRFMLEIGGGTRSPAEVSPLLNVLRSRMQMGTSRLVLSSSWKRLPRQYKKLFGRPYTLCILLLLDDALKEAKLHELPDAERLVTIAEYMDPHDPHRSPPLPNDERRKFERKTRDLWDFWVDQRGLRDRVTTI